MALTNADRSAGAHARNNNWRQRKAAEAELAEVVTEIVAPFEREQIGPELLRMALNLAKAANTAGVEVTTALERKQTAETAAILHKMGRLELGESTSNQATFAVDGDREQQLRALKARLAAVDGQGEAESQ